MLDQALFKVMITVLLVCRLMTALELIKIAKCVQISSEAFKFSQSFIENRFIEKKFIINYVWFPNDQK